MLLRVMGHEERHCSLRFFVFFMIGAEDERFSACALEKTKTTAIITYSRFVLT